MALVTTMKIADANQEPAIPPRRPGIRARGHVCLGDGWSIDLQICFNHCGSSGGAKRRSASRSSIAYRLKLA